MERCTAPLLLHPRGDFPGGPLVKARVEKEGGGGAKVPPPFSEYSEDSGFAGGMFATTPIRDEKEACW